jgi:hypothetical protein
MLYKRLLFAAALLSGLSACAGRDPNPVALVQPQDAIGSCPMLLAESQGNAIRLAALSAESSNTTAGNVALGVVGAVVFWPALFAMDFKNAADKEAAALNGRQQYLAALLVQRRCMSA